MNRIQQNRKLSNNREKQCKNNYLKKIDKAITSRINTKRKVQIAIIRNE